MTQPATSQLLELASIHPSKTNPRRNFDAGKLAELTESIRKLGVLQPILVRTNGDGFELVAGERRFRAATASGLTKIPAIVRELSDVEVLEIQVVENLQRDDLHPLEEAEGYRQLAAAKGYDVAKIAERIGRSVKYVYDRMKLLALVKEAKEYFLAGDITAGHAILLARLKPADQKRAMGARDGHAGFETTGGVFRQGRTLFGLDGKPERKDTLTTRSVRELQGWIDEHVKLEASEVDQMVLPETAATLESAEDSQKVLRITHEVMTPDVVREGPRVILGRSWQRADGKYGSKVCDHSRLGMVVIGPARGEAFRVCVAKKQCSKHWPGHVRAAKAAAKEVNRAVAAGKPKPDKYELERQKRAEAQKRENEERARYDAVMPQILEAVAARVKKMPARPGGTLVQVMMDGIDFGPSDEAEKLMPPGKTAEDLVRHIAFSCFHERTEWSRPADLAKDALAFGVDVKKILANAEKAAQTSAPAPAKKRAARA